MATNTSSQATDFVCAWPHCGLAIGDDKHFTNSCLLCRYHLPCLYQMLTEWMIRRAVNGNYPAPRCACDGGQGRLDDTSLDVLCPANLSTEASDILARLRSPTGRQGWLEWLNICSVDPLDDEGVIFAITSLEVFAIHVRSWGSFGALLEAWANGQYPRGIPLPKNRVLAIFVSPPQQSYWQVSVL